MVVSQINFHPVAELQRLSTALNSDESVQKAIAFIKEYSVTDVPILENVCFVPFFFFLHCIFISLLLFYCWFYFSVLLFLVFFSVLTHHEIIDIVLQSQLESKETALATLRSYLDSVQLAAQILHQQQQTSKAAITTTQSPPLESTNNTNALSSPSREIPTTSATSEATQQQVNSISEEKDERNSLDLTEKEKEPEKEPPSSRIGFTPTVESTHSPNPAPVQSSPFFASAFAHTTARERLTDSHSSQESEIEPILPQQTSPGSSLANSENAGPESRANVSAVVSIPVTKIKGMS
jgi:hypothetical protein